MSNASRHHTDDDAAGAVPSPADATLGDLEELAVGLAVGAGRLARRLRRAGFTVSSKSTPTDLVTEVDRTVEAWIATRLRERRPADDMIGEEGVASRRAGAVCWLVDPIDGTVNFALGLPNYAVSVAVQIAGQVVAGCVHNPESGEIYHARIGGGAFIDRDGDPLADGEADVVAVGRQAMRRELRLRGPRTVKLDRAVIGTGFGYDAARRARQADVVMRLLPRIGDVRRIGSASLDLCAVAAGRLDAFFEAGLNEWDYAAGLLIAAESGCASSGLRGQPAGTRLVAVAGPQLSGQLFELLSEFDADKV